MARSTLWLAACSRFTVRGANASLFLSRPTGWQLVMALIVFIIGLLATTTVTFGAAENLVAGEATPAVTVVQDSQANNIAIAQATSLNESGAIRTVKSHPGKDGVPLGQYLEKKSSAPAVRDLGWSAAKDGQNWIVQYSIHVKGLSSPTIYRWRVTPANEVTPINGHALDVTPQRPKAILPQNSVRAQPKAKTPPARSNGGTLVEGNMADWLQASDTDRVASARLLLLPLVEELDPHAIPSSRDSFEGFARAGAEMMEKCMTRRGRTLRKAEAVMTSAVARLCYLEIR